MTKLPSRAGFTLMELSLVLVIIGLLVGGIIGGQSLIRAAALRSVATDYGKFITAVNSFQGEFNALPGDMTNATSYWGVAHATPATCLVTIGTGTTTCDGNGDGLIADSTGSNEKYRFWQHLANAGLIGGNYTGVKGLTGVTSSTSANSPASKISNSLWLVYNWGGGYTAGGTMFNGDYYNTLEFGGFVSDSWPSAGVLRPDEAYGIDIKIDDGKPGVGKIWVGRFSTCTDTTDKTLGATASYLLSYKVADCFLFAPNAFYRYN